MMKYIEEIGSSFSAVSLSAVELRNKRDDDRGDQKYVLNASETGKKYEAFHSDRNIKKKTTWNWMKLFTDWISKA